MIGRRGFIATGASAALAPRAFGQTRRMKRVCVLISYREGSEDFRSRRARLENGLERLGWRDKTNIELSFRGASGYESLRSLAHGMKDEPCDVLVGAGSAAIEMSRAAPDRSVVAVTLAESAIAALIRSYSQPGGNLTGFMHSDRRLVQKQIELLEEALPDCEEIAILVNLESPGLAAATSGRTTDPRAYVDGLGLRSTKRLKAHLYRSPAEIDDQLGYIGQQRKTALIVHFQTSSIDNRSRIIDGAARHNLPAIYGAPVFARDGGLMSYSTDTLEQYGRVGEYIDRILKGAKAGDLPLQFPTKFELIVNVRTAKQLNLALPPSLLARADEVIE